MDRYTHNEKDGTPGDDERDCDPHGEFEFWCSKDSLIEEQDGNFDRGEWQLNQ